MLRNPRHDRIAELPCDWTVQPIRDLGELHGGSTPSRHVSRFWGGSIPWVTPGELTALRSKYLAATRECITDTGLANCGAKLLPRDALLVTSRATLGVVALASTPTATNQGFKSIVFDRGADPHFYYHLFHRLTPELARRASGTTFLEVSSREFGSVDLPVPPLSEQRLIAEILDTVDQAIRKTETIIAKLGQVKQGLLHDLLTRGIDEYGELRDPDRHPEQFKDSLLGRIPKEWEAVPLHDGVDFITDYRGSTPPYSDDGVPVISAENVGDGRVRSTTKYVEYGVYIRTSTRGFPEPGDVIFTTEAPVGEVAQVPGDRPYRLTRRVLALRPKTTWWRKNFLFWFVYYRARTGAWDAYMHGSTVPRILKPDILARLVVKPSLSEQDRIARVLDEHEVRAKAEARSLAKLRLLKQGLMDDLLTGRVRVTSLLQKAAK